MNKQGPTGRARPAGCGSGWSELALRGQQWVTRWYSYFTAVSSGTSRDRVRVPDVSSQSSGLTQCRPSVTWNTHASPHSMKFLYFFFKFKLYSSLNLSHPVCLPRHYQQPLPRFGLPWLQGGRRRRCGGGDGGRLRRLSGGCGRGGDWGGQLRSGGGGGVPVCGRQVQQDLIAPLPLVAFGALAGVGLLPLLAAVALAAVSMETGAAGTGVCEKLR